MVHSRVQARNELDKSFRFCLGVWRGWEGKKLFGSLEGKKLKSRKASMKIIEGFWFGEF